MARSGVISSKYNRDGQGFTQVLQQLCGCIVRLPILLWLMACLIALIFLVILRYQVTVEQMMMEKLVKQYVQAQRQYVLLQVERDNMLNQNVLEQVAVTSHLVPAKDSRLKVLLLYG